MNTKKTPIRNGIPYIIIIAAAVLLLPLTKRSFCFSDECFYFSTADRFLQGDRLFIHDWFPTQLVSLLLMPLLRLFNLLTGAKDGLILYFRILYLLWSLAMSLCIFHILRKARGSACALVCALWNLFYVHLNIATLSYYTLSMTFFLLCMLFIYTYISRPQRRYVLLSGLSIAPAVLALPTLVVPWVAVMLLLLCISFAAKKASIRTGMAYHIAGIAIIALPVTLYLLITTGLSGIIKNLKYLLSDEEHVMGLTYPFRNFFDSVFNVFGKPAVIGIAASFILLTILSFIPKKHALLSVSKHLAYCVGIISSLCLFRAGFLHTGFPGTIMALACLPVFAASARKHKDLPLFLTVYTGGLIFSMVYSYSSMCDLYVLSIGHNICAIAGICFMSDHIREKKEAATGMIYPITAVIITLYVLILLLSTIWLRFNNVYRDDRPENLTALIEEGPAKGLYTSPEHKEVYISLLHAIRENRLPGKKIFFSKLLPWGYLAADMECASYTTWRVPLSSERLRQYYTVHPEKKPDVVFVLKEYVGSYEKCGDVEADPIPNRNDPEGSAIEEILYEDQGDQGYKVKEYDHCRVYFR